VSLVARFLEANGIPTVIIGSALDIVEHCGVPRFLYADFPLGNPCGVPYDHSMQLSIISEAIALLRTATSANTTERLPHIWSEDNDWRDDYGKVDDSNREELAQRGDARRRLQAEEKATGSERSAMIAEA
jgi:D-proline reductase (dithiol) PrdB